MNSPNKQVLSILVIAQFCCTSLWFAGNGIMEHLLRTFNLEISALGHLTSAIQLGFIIGTLGVAFFNIADRYPSTRVFFICAILGAGFNLGMLYEGNSFWSLLLCRFLTGISLAGIYPVGMKIAADYFQTGLGKSLGYLVGALVLGTALPHLLNFLTASIELPWKLVVFSTSAFAVLGGLLILILLAPGPNQKTGKGQDHLVFLKVFANPKFRAAAFGYFGHMWELYTFWAFIPLILGSFSLRYPETPLNIPLITFFIIGSGGLACVAAGYISQRWGTKKTAGAALLLSGLCCLVSPLVFLQGYHVVLIIFLLFWGFTVVADSPLFSTLVAQNAAAEHRGTALTIVNSIGFIISILSIQAITYLEYFTSPMYLLLLLAVGPFLGLLGMFRKKG